MRAPDFFVVGAPKAGTTSLYRWLAQHPAIFMSPIKEPCFFAPEVVDYTPRSREFHEADALALREWLDGPMTEPRSHGIVLDWDDYLSLFRHAGKARAAGEVSGNYLHSWNAPAGISERIPQARIIMMLRDPAERLFSHFASAVGAGEATGTFGAWIDAQEAAESLREPRFGPIWTGMYARHLRRWLNAFRADQVRVYLFDDYRVDPVAVLCDIFSFLGVDASHPVDTSERHNVTTVPRWPGLRRFTGPVTPAIDRILPRRLASTLRRWYRGPARFRPTTADRARLAAMYTQEISELQDLIGRDLGRWLGTEPTGPTSQVRAAGRISEDSAEAV